MGRRRNERALEELDSWLDEHSVRHRLFKGRRRYAWASVPVAAVVLAFFLLNSSTPLFKPTPVPINRPTSDFTGGTVIQGPLRFQPTLNPCTNDYRYDYGLNCTDQQLIFGGLPFFHADTYDIANYTYSSYLQGGTWDISSVTSDYWLQPEFYPNWRADIPAMAFQSSAYHTPQGYGVYPWIRGWTVPVCSAGASGQALTGTFLLHTGWNVDAWQGFGMYALFPAKAVNLNGTTHFTQDPAYAAQHVNVSMTAAADEFYDTLRSNSSFQPIQYPSYAIAGTQRAVVLEPVQNPVYVGFHRGWAEPIALTVKLSGVAAGDRFVVDVYGVDMNSWLVDHYIIRYGPYYFNTDGSLYGGPWLQYVIEVTPCT